jgi:hypothetical protein
MRGSKVRWGYVTRGADAVAVPDRRAAGVHSVELHAGFRVTQGAEKILE